MNSMYGNPSNPAFAQREQNILPPQQVIEVNGEESARAIRMYPNSSVILMDKSEPIVWLCVSDGIGTVSVQGFDIAPRKKKQPVDMDELDSRLSAIEAMLANIGGIGNGKSDVAISEQGDEEQSRGVDSDVREHGKGGKESNAGNANARPKQS